MDFLFASCSLGVLKKVKEFLQRTWNKGKQNVYVWRHRKLLSFVTENKIEFKKKQLTHLNWVTLMFSKLESFLKDSLILVRRKKALKVVVVATNKSALLYFKRQSWNLWALAVLQNMILKLSQGCKVNFLKWFQIEKVILLSTTYRMLYVVNHHVILRASGRCSKIFPFLFECQRSKVHFTCM